MARLRQVRCVGCDTRHRQDFLFACPDCGRDFCRYCLAAGICPDCDERQRERQDYERYLMSVGDSALPFEEWREEVGR